MTIAEVLLCIQSARKAFATYSQMPFEQRLELLGDFQRSVKNDSSAAMPSGVVLVITPKTWGLRVATEAVSRALLAGNTVLLKPSSADPETAQKFFELAKKLPEGVLQVITGKGSELSAIICAHPSVRAIYFAGSNATAAKIIPETLQTQKKLQMHLGANNSALVLADEANVYAPLAESCLREGGQLPWSIKKVFVLDSFQANFADRMALEFKKYSPFKLQSRTVFENHKKGLEQIRSEQGKVIVGGECYEKAGEFFATATLIKDLPNCSELQQQELLGPVVLLTSVKYQHEMVKWANNSPFGLAASVYGDPEKAQKVAAKLEVGEVWINRWIRDEDPLPVGVKQSVYGIMDAQVFGAFYSDRRKID